MSYISGTHPQPYPTMNHRLGNLRPMDEALIQGTMPMPPQDPKMASKTIPKLASMVTSGVRPKFFM